MELIDFSSFMRFKGTVVCFDVTEYGIFDIVISYFLRRDATLC